MPDSKPTVPDTKETVPDTEQAVPDTQKAVPDTKETVPDTPHSLRTLTLLRVLFLCSLNYALFMVLYNRKSVENLHRYYA